MYKIKLRSLEKGCGIESLSVWVADFSKSHLLH